MATILMLEPFREKKRLERERAGPPERARPVISDGEIWTKDYAQLDGVVFGASKIREILEFHRPFDDQWPYLILALVDAVFNLERWGIEEVSAAGQALKGYITGRLDERNKRDLTAALMLVDLIQKTPSYRRSLHC